MTLTLPTDHQIHIVRRFDAPAALVWRAYTEPDLVRRWWHAGRGAMTACDIDLRVGGAYRFAMVAHHGEEVGFHGEYREVVPSERLVHTEVYEGDPTQTEALDTITFEEEGGRTTLTIVMDLPSKEARDQVVASGMEDGLQDALALLEGVARALPVTHSTDE